MTYIDLGGPGCVRLKYLSAEEGIALNVSYGDSVLHSQRVKGPDPAPTCLSMFARLAQMCARFKELLPTDDGMRGCLQLEPMLLGEVQIELPLGCFRMGPKGVELIKSSEDEIKEQQPNESVERAPAAATADEKKEDDDEAKPIAPAGNITSPLSLLDNLSTADILAAVSESTDEGIAMISSWFGLGTTKKTDQSESGTDSSSSNIHIPESEDGGSLLGSSRKSLADTSVTSTADLSVLSGGQSQRSHNAFELGYDDHHPKTIESADEGEGESSPGLRKRAIILSAKSKPIRGPTSAAGSMSVVARSPSAQMATPRAMSPHDVVRIYVPPAPPEELVQKNAPAHSASTTTMVAAAPTSNVTKKDSFSNSKTNVNRYSNGSNYSGGGTPVVGSRQSNYQDEDDDESKTRRNSEIELYQPTYSSGRFEFGSDYGTTTSSVQNYGMNGRSTSSSRRGSMSRKSPAPMLDGEFIIECSHLKGRKYVPEHHTSHNSLNQSHGGRIRNGSESNIHRMTSFEELAKNKCLGGSNNSLLKNVNDDYIIRQMIKAKGGNRLTKSEIYETVDSSESGSNDRYEMYASINSQKISRGHKSDYNIQYKNLSTRSAMGVGGGGGSHEYNSIEYKAFKTRQGSRESGNDSSPFDYDLLPDGSRHENSVLRDYNRFFNNEDDDEDKLLNKSSDESSTSPPPVPNNNKQMQYVQHHPNVVNSPCNESVPLLMSPGRKSSVPSQSSGIPMSSSMKRNKYGGDSFRLELSSPQTSSNRRNTNESTSSAASSAFAAKQQHHHQQHQQPAPAGSRIPVVKSPGSPPSSQQGSLRQQPHNKSRIPTSQQPIYSPLSPTGMMIHTNGRTATHAAPAGSRIPSARAFSPTGSGPSSLVSSQRGGGGGDSSLGRPRIGSSNSAHQIQHSAVGGDSNKIRIKVNQSQSYSSG